jgi:hypothetical protein
MRESFTLPLKTFSMDQKPDSDGPGIYFIFLRERSELGGFVAGKERLIYIGKSESTIEARNHANYSASSSSTLRRSLGAILRASFPDTEIFPRTSTMRLSGKGLEKATQNFRFSEQSEVKLGRWMLENLEYGYEIIKASAKEIRAQEKHYIEHWKPILNLTNCCHPEGKRVKELRKQCREEAMRRTNGHE